MSQFQPPSIRHEPPDATFNPILNFTPLLAADIVRDVPALPPIEALVLPDRHSPNPYGDYERHFMPDGSVRLLVPEGRISWMTLFTDIANSLAGATIGWFIVSVLAEAMTGGSADVGPMFLIFGIITYVFVCTPPAMHSVEIKPDCMVLDDQDVFWASQFELSFPNLGPDVNDEWKLTGIYGTRFIEFLSIRKHDDNDRTPELAAMHLQRAMQQLWGQPGAI